MIIVDEDTDILALLYHHCIDQKIVQICTSYEVKIFFVTYLQSRLQTVQIFSLKMRSLRMTLCLVYTDIPNAQSTKGIIGDVKTLTNVISLKPQIHKSGIEAMKIIL